MLSRDQLKQEIDAVSEQNLKTLYQIILLFQKLRPATARQSPPSTIANPLKNSVTFEHDLISPIDISWDAQA
ncbi:MAG: hypothetical protein AAF152_14985 [Cyanobacteria bacterium P01_A01_bin.114]